MIIDAHAHVFENPLIKQEPQGDRYIKASDQIDLMDRIGVDKAVILPLSNPEATCEYQGINEILNICRAYPGRFIPFCCVDPRRINQDIPIDADYFEFILEQYKQLGCKGMGELIAKVWWDDPRLLALLEACERVGFPVTFHTSLPEAPDYGPMDEPGFGRFEKVLQRFPNLVFLAHSMSYWTEISGDFTMEDKYEYPTGPVKPGGTVTRLMRQYPNLYGDLSAGSGLNALTRDPEHAWKFIDEFQNKLIFGLDYCFIDQERQHIEWLNAALKEDNISRQAYDKIMYKNISKVLGLESP